MILLGFLLVMQQPTMPRGTCPDLSGRYVIQGEDGRVYVSIKQTRCERIEIEWLIHSYPETSRTTHLLVLDGKFRADTGWFGGGKQLTSAQFRSNVLEIVARPATAKDTAAFEWKQSFEVLPNKDLCTKFLDPHMESWSARRAGRQKSNDRAGEDEAARRSEERC
jgi:hypothetical protein